MTIVSFLEFEPEINGFPGGPFVPWAVAVFERYSHIYGIGFEGVVFGFADEPDVVIGPAAGFQHIVAFAICDDSVAISSEYMISTYVAHYYLGSLYGLPGLLCDCSFYFVVAGRGAVHAFCIVAA